MCGSVKQKVEKNGDSFTNGDGKDFDVSAVGYRHKQCLVLFFCIMIAYSMRTCMGVALVAMVDDTLDADLHDLTNGSIMNDLNQTLGQYVGVENRSDVTNTSSNQIREPPLLYEEESYQTHGILNSMLFTPPYPKFKWSKKMQDTVLSSFFWGYMTLQVPGGQMSHRFGCRRLLTGALAINAVVSFCLPWAVYYGGWICTVICRVLQGLSQACIVPSMHSFFGKWAPLEERSRLSGFAQGGQAIGAVLGLPITGFLASSPLGWPGIFRFYGLLSGGVAVLAFFMVADSPADHPKISEGERRYIAMGLGGKDGDKKKYLPVPWKKILTSRGMIVISVAHIGQTWGQLTLFSEVPAFMDKVMGVNIKANGLLTALPFLMMWFTNFFFNWFTDMVIVKKILSPTNARKMANSLGCVPPAIGLIILAYAPKNIYVMEVILVVIGSFTIATHVGFMVNHIDISPNFAGPMMSVSNCVSNLVGSQAPLLAGFLLTDVTSEYDWRKVFFAAAGIYLITNTVYVIFGTAETAEWNNPPEEPVFAAEEGAEAEPMMKKNGHDSDIKNNT